MKDNVLEYKGYYTLIRYDAHARKLRGVINGIDDYVDFSSDQVENIEQEFHQAVDDYLEFCKEVGKEHARFIKEYSMYGYSLSFIGNLCEFQK